MSRAYFVVKTVSFAMPVASLLACSLVSPFPLPNPLFTSSLAVGASLLADCGCVYYLSLPMAESFPSLVSHM